MAAGKKGITFSAVGTEEGSFQFLPWFWGAGADLTALDSAEAEASLTLWTDWVKDGLAPHSVLQNTQGTSWDEFLTGEFGFAENGSWFKSAADEAGYQVIQVPGDDGRLLPLRTGGEFITIPIQKDTLALRHLGEDREVPQRGRRGCRLARLHRPDRRRTGGAAGRRPEPRVLGDAVGDAKPRTADNLGVSYGIISEQLYTAIQNALSGASSPADALAAAQQAATEKLG